MEVPKIGRHIVAAIVVAVTAACGGHQAFVQAAHTMQPDPARKVQVFVLPAGYLGPVMVIYDQPDGQHPKTINGQVVYDVPATGIVRTAYPEEVLAGAQVKFVYKSSSALWQYHNCTQMRLRGLASDPAAVCWLAIQVGDTGTPDRAIYIVTDWIGIPENYDRGARMLDSLFFGGKGVSKFKWTEPKAAPAQTTT